MIILPMFLKGGKDCFVGSFSAGFYKPYGKLTDVEIWKRDRK